MVLRPAELAAELRRSIRALARAPVVSGVVVATLGLAIGLDTALFSLVHGVLLQPLPYTDADRLVALHAELPGGGIEEAPFMAADFRHLERTTRTLERLEAVFSIRQNLEGTDRPRQVLVGWGSGGLFELLGTEAAVGRVFRSADPPGTAVLGHAFWREAWGSDPDVLGRTVRLDGHPYTVVGVLPAGFRTLLPGVDGEPDVWKVPDDFWQNGPVWSEDERFESAAVLHLFGRLAPATSVAAVRAEMDAIAASLRGSNARFEELGFGIGVAPLRDRVVRDVDRALWLLFAAVGLVLLVACANVLMLLLARARRRRGELALRRALGATRRGLVGMLVRESALLGLAGGAAGLAVAAATLEGLRRVAPPGIPRLEEVALSTPVLAFAAAVVVGTTLLFGTLPALEADRGPLAALLGSRRTTGDRRGRRWGSGLVVGQVAVSMVLLVAAGLLAGSLAALSKVDAGFRTHDVWTFSVSLPGTSYERPLGTDRALRQLEERLESRPEIASAGVVWPLPFGEGGWSGGWSGGEVAAETEALAGYRLATPDLFETLGVPLVEGRTFGAADPRHTVVVSRSLAARAWPGESALGRVVEADPWGGGPEPFEVVGVAEDVRFGGPTDAPKPTLWFDSRGWSWTDWEVFVAVRTRRADAGAAVVVPLFRDALAAVDPSLPLADPRPMTARVSDHLAPGRFALALVGLFAVTAGLLAALGLYGVVAHGVAARRREMGLRLALGATPAVLRDLVLRQGAGLAALGVAIGTIGALLAARTLESFLYEVGPTEPGVLVGVGAGLVAVALAASWLPARRAAGADPAVVLREE